MTEVRNPKQPWWQIALTIVVVIVVGGTARYCSQEVFETGRRALTPQSEMEAMLDRYADRDPFMSSFRDSFPQDWIEFRRASAADVKSSASDGEVETRAVARMRRFMTDRVAWTAAAPIPELNSALSAETALIEQLSIDSIELCARYGMAGLNGSETLSAGALRLMNDAAVKKVIATRTGRDQPHTYGEITTEDVEALVDGMIVFGANQSVIDLLLSDASLGTPSQQCEGSVALYRSIENMPDDQAARVYATILLGAAAEHESRAR